jgi:predicted RecA/RadA family phage recombinase
MATGAALWPGAASARTVSRGVADPAIVSMPADQQAVALHEISSELDATYVRFVVSWAAAEPQKGAYDPASPYMTGVASAVSLARQEGLRVMITFSDVPKWASDQKYWHWATMGGYKPYGAMNTTYLPDFRAFCQAVATQLQGQVYAYECWNEPNLWVFIFPQSTSQDRNFGAHLYVKMLRSCSVGIRDGDSAALVVAGATSPRGNSPTNAGSSSPLRFAAVIKAAKVLSLFNAYSHHPYTPGASAKLWPEAAPRNPKTTVNLRNLGTLLKLFPSKSFFLTEYGYQTEACRTFSGQHVNQITQALYLKRAYSYVARYRQVKLLMWYLLKDQSRANPFDGFYTGLRTTNGARKRAWYAFARGNHLTLSAPASIKSGAMLTLTGQLSCTSVDGLSAGKPLVMQRRLGHGSWSTVKTFLSGTAGVYTEPGLYTVRLRPKASASYRVAWLGVVTSSTRSVRVK